ncbi:hypothetical protein DL95DRAFT_312540 [Leptodontidium sp. 2 PMI_412]|nr:hypothetical protein DL95DRAFT_312540 [Leptodontidium sp. 2 PMI_412]
MEPHRDKVKRPSALDQNRIPEPLSKTKPELIEENGPPSAPQSKFWHFLSPLLLAILTTGIFGLTAWYANAAGQFGSAIAVLRILQGLLATLTTVALSNTFEAIQWALISNGSGIGCLKLLAISPVNGVLGTLGLLFDTQPRIVERSWAVLRLTTIVATWLAGILLFIKTSSRTEYYPVYTYEVTAGIGAFNGSYVLSFLDDLQNSQPGYNSTIVPFNLIAMSYNLVGNPMQATIAEPVDDSCGGVTNPCDSYLFTGGISMTTPWAPTDHPSSPLINIYDLPAVQFDFKRDIGNIHVFLDNECGLYGSDGTLVGVRLCISEDTKRAGSYLAGIYVCTNGISNGECLTSTPAPNLTTAFSIFNRKASIVTSRLNYTIVSVLEVGEPNISNSIDLPSYRLAMDWLLDFNASGTPAPSSIAGVFWSAPDQLGSRYWSSELYNVLKSLLVFPIWQFNPNNFGNTQLAAREIISGLPSEFYTTASVVKPYTRIVIDRSMFISFLVLEGAMLLLVWLVPLWLCLSRRRLPRTSSYPLIDFMFKSSVVSGASLDDLSRRMLFASDKETRSVLKDVSISGSRNDY